MIVFDYSDIKARMERRVQVQDDKTKANCVQRFANRPNVQNVNITVTVDKQQWMREQANRIAADCGVKLYDVQLWGNKGHGETIYDPPEFYFD